MKIGDNVRVSVEQPQFGWGTVNKGDIGIYKGVALESTAKPGEIVVDFPNHPGWNGILSEIEVVVLVEIMRKEATTWSFKSQTNIDVDYIEIAEELTRKNPIAIITMQGEDETKYEVMHSLYLQRKSEACGIDIPEGDARQITFLGYITRCQIEDWVNWINWAKEVKKAKWPEDIINKTKVTITLPKV